MLVSLALVPPREVSRVFAALRAQIDPEHAPKTIPHLTVKQPFHCEPLHFEQVVARVSTLCAQQHSLDIALREAGIFDTAMFGSVLHLSAPRTAVLDVLHRAILHALSDFSAAGPQPEVEDRVFYPHLTLAQGLTRADAEHHLSALALSLPITFEASELVLGVRDEDGMWHRPHTFPLKRRA